MKSRGSIFTEVDIKSSHLSECSTTFVFCWPCQLSRCLLWGRMEMKSNIGHLFHISNGWYGPLIVLELHFNEENDAYAR